VTDFSKKGNGKRTKITDYSTKKGERRLKIALWQQEEFLDNLIIIFKKGIGNKKKKEMRSREKYKKRSRKEKWKDHWKIEVKGIVQRDFTEGKNQAQTIRTDQLTCQCFFFILKGHHCERSKKPVSAS
jgi:hypothetical protein